MVLSVAFNHLNAQYLTHANLIHKEDGKYYLVENGWESLVNDKVITVKFKEGKQYAEKDIVTINKNKLGYIDIKVPDSVSLEDYAFQLEKSGNFDLINYNIYGTVCTVPNDEFVDEQL